MPVVPSDISNVEIITRQPELTTSTTTTITTTVTTKQTDSSNKHHSLKDVDTKPSDEEDDGEFLNQQRENPDSDFRQHSDEFRQSSGTRRHGHSKAKMPSEKIYPDRRKDMILHYTFEQMDEDIVLDQSGYNNNGRLVEG